MTTAEVKKQVKEMRKFRNEVRQSPELARKLLQGTGMYDKNGTLKKQFR